MVKFYIILFVVQNIVYFIEIEVPVAVEVIRGVEPITERVFQTLCLGDGDMVEQFSLLRPDGSTRFCLVISS